MHEIYFSLLLPSGILQLQSIIPLNLLQSTPSTASILSNGSGNSNSNSNSGNKKGLRGSRKGSKANLNVDGSGSNKDNNNNRSGRRFSALSGLPGLGTNTSTNNINNNSGDNNGGGVGNSGSSSGRNSRGQGAGGGSGHRQSMAAVPNMKKLKNNNNNKGGGGGGTMDQQLLLQQQQQQQQQQQHPHTDSSSKIEMIPVERITCIWEKLLAVSEYYRPQFKHIKIIEEKRRTMMIELGHYAWQHIAIYNNNNNGKNR